MPPPTRAPAYAAEAVRDAVFGPVRALKIRLQLADAAAVAFLERRTQVLAREYEGDAVVVETRLGRRQAEELQSHTRNATVDGLPLPEQAVVVTLSGLVMMAGPVTPSKDQNVAPVFWLS